MTTIKRGANLLLKRSLFQEDGTTPLPAASLSVCKVELRQGNRTVKTVLRGATELRNHNSDANALELELTSAITLSLKKGELTERYTLGVDNALYVVEPGKELHVLEITDVTIEL